MTQPMRLLSFSLAAALLLTGCTNPFVEGFTGTRGVSLHEHAPVKVVGADREVERQMKRFDEAMIVAEADRPMLGSSTIVSATPLRDETAVEAARELGASMVVYNFAYLSSTVERDRRSYRRYDHDTGDYYHEYSSFDSTKHWYEYRAYFFAEPGE